MSLSTTLAGFDLKSCLMNASGCYCSTHNQLDQLSTSLSGTIVTKSGTIHYREGNSMPRMHFDEYGSINSIGLANPSYKYYMDYKTPKPYIQSIYPFSLQDLSVMLTNINKKSKCLIEVNLSCPNVHDNNYFEEYNKYFDLITQLRVDNLTIGIKLAPIFDINYYQEIGHMLLKNNIKFITCCNSLPNGLMVNYVTEQTMIRPNYGLGGISGLYAKPISLANVYNFNRVLNDKIDIIGCGGIKTGTDVFEYILCGAKAVQIGTQLIKEGVECFDRIDTELNIVLNSKGYKHINDFRGKIMVCGSAKL